jgi:hypothetical protein
LFATDAMSPLTCASPPGVGVDDPVVGAVVGAVVVGEATTVLGEVVPLGGELDELHAATDSAAAPVTARIATRPSRGDVTDINISPIVSWSRRSGLPDGPVH